jgi:hypothetical protein
VKVLQLPETKTIHFTVNVLEVPPKLGEDATDIVAMIVVWLAMLGYIAGKNPSEGFEIFVGSNNKIVRDALMMAISRKGFALIEEDHDYILIRCGLSTGQHKDFIDHCAKYLALAPINLFKWKTVYAYGPDCDTSDGSPKEDAMFKSIDLWISSGSQEQIN